MMKSSPKESMDLPIICEEDSRMQCLGDQVSYQELQRKEYLFRILFSYLKVAS